jgi:hypothetical protein
MFCFIIRYQQNCSIFCMTTDATILVSNILFKNLLNVSMYFAVFGWYKIRWINYFFTLFITLLETESSYFNMLPDHWRSRCKGRISGPPLLHTCFWNIWIQISIRYYKNKKKKILIIVSDIVPSQDDKTGFLNKALDTHTVVSMAIYS